MEQKVVKSCKNCKFFEKLTEEGGKCTVGTFLLSLQGKEYSFSEFVLPPDFGCNKFEKKKK